MEENAGSFNVRLFSQEINDKTRFQVLEFRSILKKIRSSFSDPAINDCEPDAFTNALQWLPTYFCEEDQSLVYREITRACLMYPEVRNNAKYKPIINICISNYLDCLKNKKSKPQINDLLSGIGSNAPTERDKWHRYIKSVIDNNRYNN